MLLLLTIQKLSNGLDFNEFPIRASTEATRDLSLAVALMVRDWRWGVSIYQKKNKIAHRK